MKEFLIGAAGIVLAGTALAQTPAAQTAPSPAPQVAPAAPAPMFREHTRNEVVARVREHFAQLDTNRDGSLTKEEAEAGRKIFKERVRSKIGERRAERRDPNAAFDRLDTNKDGAISRDEFAQHRERRIERVVNRTPGAPAAPRPRLGLHRMGRMMMGGHMFTMADANKDNRVTLQEATDAAVRHFDMADANRDGRITPEERRQMRQRRAPKAG